MLAPKELKEIHSLGKAPVVTIEEEGQETVVLPESGAITEYLIHRFAGKESGLSGAVSKHKEYAEYREGPAIH